MPSQIGTRALHAHPGRKAHYEIDRRQAPSTELLDNDYVRRCTGQRWVWHTRPRLIIPIWEHVSALTNQRHRRLRYSRGAELWLQNTAMSMLRTRYGPALSLPTTDGHELEPPNNGNVGWSANEPYTTAFVVKSRSGGAATRHIFRSGSSSTGNHILFTTTGPVPNARHEVPAARSRSAAGAW